MATTLFSPLRIHIPDGFLTPWVAGIGWLVALVLIAVALRQTRQQMKERQVPLMGILAAFVFAAQVVNFPVAAGTSGHLLGAALASIVVGPWAALLMMTCVVAVQGLLFQDGGLLAMGWNIVNMGVFAVFASHLGYTLVRRVAGAQAGSRLAGAFVAAWISIEAGAIATAFELSASGTSPLSLALPAMAGIHALIGLGEGIITAAAVGLLQVVRPQVLEQADLAPGRKSAAWMVGGVMLVLLIAMLSPLASQSPDGLESVAQSQGFLELARESPWGLIGGYIIPFIRNPAVATILAVALGSLVVFGVGLMLGKSAARRAQRGK